MRLITIYAAMVAWVLFAATLLAQETTNTNSIEVLRQTREQIINEEKDALKRDVEAINKQLEDGEISQEEAEQKKLEAAEVRALNIENRVAIIDNKIALIERNPDGDYADDDDSINVTIFTDESVIDITTNHRRRKYDRRTTSHLVFAFGLNNVITEGESLDDSQFKVGGSRFAELGWAWRTRVFKNSNWLRIKYGFSFVWNGLKPIDNQYYVDTGDQSELQTFPLELDKSKFRIDNLVFPVHFEVGPSRKIERDDYFRYSTRRKFKFGFGGYAGFKLGIRQKLRYTEDGQKIKEKQKGSFNTNNFIYGISGYMGWSGISLYCKYDLNPIFKDNPVEQRNISLGLRLDVD